MFFDPLYLVRLHSGIRGMTPSLMRDMLHSCVNQSMSLADIFEMSESDLTDLYPTMKPDVATQLVNSEIDNAKKTLEQLQNKEFNLVTVFDEQYPPQYAPFAGSIPPLLYVYGDTQLLQKAGIGFGGSRNVSDDGLYATDKLAHYAVAELTHTVISGHAKGVDITAHQSALANDGDTILVLPEGALTFRLKKTLRDYWAKAKDRFVIITQFAPNEPWHVRNAMARNVTTICLSKAFCVIESGDEKGGTWQAGNIALNKKIPLYVIDYPNPPESASGNKKLITKGGIPIPYSQDLNFPPIDIPQSLPIQNKLF